MAERMMSRPESSGTIVEEVDGARSERLTPTLRLKCKKPKSNKCVQWNADTIDNENMNKKKSKCCCIYKKPKQRFDESSESESDECENCFGHVEVKNQKKTEKSGDESTAGTSKDVALDHVQPITPSSIPAVSS